MMKKEEFLTRLRKNLSVLEEREIQDIVEEYEQHIDMKMKEGLSEEEAIKDFGEIKELTAGILEAYHVKADYNTEKKNLDFEKVMEESKRVTEKATSAIGRGAGAMGRGAGTAGKWGLRQIKRLWYTVKYPFIRIKDRFSQNRERAKGQGFFGRVWATVLDICGLFWKLCVWCLRLSWNVFWLLLGIMCGFCTLGSVFFFGVLVVLLAMGYPLAGMMMIVIGGGLISSAAMLFCFSLLWKKQGKKDNGNTGKDIDMRDSHTDDLENNWDYPEEDGSKGKRITVNEYQEVLNHA